MLHRRARHAVLRHTAAAVVAVRAAASAPAPTDANPAIAPPPPPPTVAAVGGKKPAVSSSSGVSRAPRRGPRGGVSRLSSVDPLAASGEDKDRAHHRSFYGVRRMFDDVFAAADVQIEAEQVRYPLRCHRASCTWKPTPSVTVLLAEKTGRPQSSMQSDVRALATAAVGIDGRSAAELWRTQTLSPSTGSSAASADDAGADAANSGNNDSTRSAPAATGGGGDAATEPVLDYNLSLPPVPPETRPMHFDCDVTEARTVFEQHWLQGIEWSLLERMCVEASAKVRLELSMRDIASGGQFASIALPGRTAGLHFIVTGSIVRDVDDAAVGGMHPSENDATELGGNNGSSDGSGSGAVAAPPIEYSHTHVPAVALRGATALA